MGYVIGENITAYILNNPRGKAGFSQTIIDTKFEELLEVVKPDIAHIGHLNHLSTGIVNILHAKNIPIIYTLHDFWLMCPRGQFLQSNFGKEKNYQLCSGQDDSKCADNCYRAFFTGENEENDFHYWKQWVNVRMKATYDITKKVELFIAPSKYLRNRFISEFGIPENKIIYLDYGFPTHYLKPVLKYTSTSFRFGYIGTHIPAKGVNLLIEAFSKVKGDISLQIWGRENNPGTAFLKALAGKCKKPIIFKGEYVNRNLAKEVFSSVDCIVVPSIWTENSPLVIHEAQACGVPVITANIGGMAEYVNHMENGLLFAHRDIDDLAIKMQYAVDNPNKMKELGAKGYLYSDNGLIPSIETHCDELEKLYNQTIRLKCKVSGVLQ